MCPPPRRNGGIDLEVFFLAVLALAGVRLLIPIDARSQGERMHRLAERLGLSAEGPKRLGAGMLHGRVGNHPVRVDHQLRHGTRMAVGAQLRGRVHLEPKHLWFFDVAIRARDRLELEGPAAAMLRQLGLARLFLLLLDAGEEALLDACLYSAHVAVVDDEVVLTCPEHLESPEIIGAVLAGLARLAEALESPTELASRLGDNARDSSAPDRRRLSCLHLLLEHFPETTHASRTSWSIGQAPIGTSPDGARLGLLARRHLAAFDAQVELADDVDHLLAQTHPEVRAVAVEALLALPPDEARSRLKSALVPGPTAVTRVAVQIAPLVCGGEDEDCERLLLELLYRGDVSLRPEVVIALAVVGSPRAMGPLLDLDRVSDGSIRRLCRYALDRLGGRHPEREGGALSLVGSGGQISLPAPRDEEDS